MKLLRSILSPVFVCTLVAAPAVAQSPIKGTLVSTTEFSASIGSGARALAMGGAFIAIADDASAASWNPAGLCVLEKPEFSVVYQAIRKSSFGFATSDFTETGGQSQYAEVDFANTLARSGNDLDFASLSYPFRLGSLKLVPQFNYQRAVPFGGTRRDPNQAYSGRATSQPPFTYGGIFAQDGTYSGALDIYSASLGVSFTPKLYFGASLNLWRKGSDGTGTSTDVGTSTDFRGALDTYSDLTSNHLSETFRGTSFNVGAIYNMGKFRLGAVFKSGFTLAYTQSSKLTDIFTTTQTQNPPFTFVHSQKGDIHWPRTLGAGLAFLPKDVLTFSLDFTTSNWSGATYTFVDTSTDTKGNPRISKTVTRRWPTLSDPDHPEKSNNSPQSDTQQIRFGTEYVFKGLKMARLSVLPVRAGVFSDRQIFKNATNLGNVNFLGVSAGFGLVWSHITLDFAYVHQSGSYRDRVTNSINPLGDGTVTDLAKGRTDDTFRSNKLYISSIIRF
jgi:long-subunit fatty acid transport protein